MNPVAYTCSEQHLLYARSAGVTMLAEVVLHGLFLYAGSAMLPGEKKEVGFSCS
jgi:hypothetical protein